MSECRAEDTEDSMDKQMARCKIVVVGDTQCGKTALLHVFAKDCYPEVDLLHTPPSNHNTSPLL